MKFSKLIPCLLSVLFTSFAQASSPVICRDSVSNTNYYVLVSDWHFSAGTTVQFGKLTRFAGPVLYQNTFTWGSGAEQTDPGNSSVLYDGFFDHFGNTEGAASIHLHFQKAAADAYPYFVNLYLPSGHGDEVVTELTCSER